MNKVLHACLLIMLSAGAVLAQAPKSVLGTVSALTPGKEMTVKPDTGTPVTIKLAANTSAQRIPPGETSLKNATTIALSDMAVGDRVLVTLVPNTTEALRVLVMAAKDIAKHDDADQQDWNKRGINGIVSARSGDQITLKTKGPQGDATQILVISDKTRIKRYAPDSVKFADAKVSKLDDINVGDQVRARGDKGADGKVAAEDVIFGTFNTLAGSVVAVDAPARTITVKELGTAKSVVVQLTGNSTIKQMTAPAPGVAPAGENRGGAPGFGGAPNVAQMVDGMPLAKFDDLKAGASVVISSTKGAQTDQVTAILVITNADALIKMASTPNGRGGTVTFGSAGGGGIDVTGLP